MEAANTWFYLLLPCPLSVIKKAIVNCLRFERRMGGEKLCTLPEIAELLKNNLVRYNNAPSSGLQPSPM